MGMRQRYLLGRFTNQRYGIKDLKSIDVQSTDVYRTIQSGYSELAGLSHEVEEPLTLSSDQTTGPKHAPFQVRRNASIETALGNQSIVDGFVNMPIKLSMIS